VATVEQCRTALHQIADRLRENDRRTTLNRSLACYVRDLDVAFHGRFQDGTIVGIADGDDSKADIRLSMSSDDLLAMVAGELNIGSAWASGKVSVKASFSDLLALRKLL
jgi:putative sterol carrier protein